MTSNVMLTSDDYVVFQDTFWQTDITYNVQLYFICYVNLPERILTTE